MSDQANSGANNADAGDAGKGGDAGSNDSGKDTLLNQGAGDGDQGGKGADDGKNQQQQADGKQGQNGDGKSGDSDAGKGDDSKENGDGKPQGAPEKYEFKAPEGKEFDPEMLSAFEAGARKANLPQEAAQEILDSMGTAMAARQEKIATAWADETRGDKELGGDKLNETLSVTKKVLDTFGDDEARVLLDSTGLGNHLAFVRLFHKIGKAISEDTFVGDRAGDQSADPARVMYDNMN